MSLTSTPPSPPSLASSALKPAATHDAPHHRTHQLLQRLVELMQQAVVLAQPPDPVEQQPALVIEPSAAGTVTSRILRREGRVTIVETIGSGTGTVTILDQPHGGAPQATADVQGTRQVSGHEKWLVAGVMDAFTVQLTVTSGSLAVLVGFAESGENVHDFASKLFDWSLSAPSSASGATPVQASTFPCSAVFVQNDPSNNAGAAGNFDIYVGNATSQSIRLRPGDGETFRISDANKLYVVCVSTNTPRVNCHAKP